MKRLTKIIYVSLTMLAVVTSPLSLFSKQTDAVSASDWRAGNIMDDFTFTNEFAFTTAQIQSWLDNRLSNCDPQGAKVSELGGGTDYNRDGVVTRAEYGRTKGNPPPFTCLNNYYEVPKTSPGSKVPASNYGKSTKPAGSKSAASLIYDAARAYNISPKVLLVKLGTESALVNDTWPLKVQYTYAMGAHCPDSGPGGSANCDTDYSGFSLQIREAAALLRYYLDSMTEPWWTLKKPKATNYILYAPQERGCSPAGKNIYIENKATAALYTYTPYQPNTASLNAYPGTGNNCSTYGNRNFWFAYNNWFGTTRNPGGTAIQNRFDTLSPQAKAGLGSAKSTVKCTLRNNGCYQSYTNGAIIWTDSTGAWENYGAVRTRWSQLGNQDGKLGYPLGGMTCNLRGGGCYQKYENGYIIGNPTTGYWESTGSIRTRWAALGYQDGSLGYPAGAEVKLARGGYYQKYENGYIIGKSDTGYWESVGASRNRWAQLGYQDGALGYPKTALLCGIKDGGCYQKYEHGNIIGNPTTGYWESTGSIRTRWAALGYQDGILGYPVAGEKRLPSGGYYQKYEDGYIVGKSSTGYWESYGLIRDKWGQLKYQDGALGYPIGGVVQQDISTYFQAFQHNKIYYQPPSTLWVGR